MNKLRQARKKPGRQTPLTRTEARQFRARWELVNTAEQMELQSTSLDQKLRQLAALMASAEAMGWTEALAAEEAEVRDRWNRLRAIFGE
jgi:hypothetical protein